MTTLTLFTPTTNDVSLFHYAATPLRDKVVRQIEPELRQRLHDGGSQSLYLDMGEVEFVTASGLGDLIALHRAIRDTGGRLTLCNVNSGPFEVFRLCQLVEVLDVHAKEPRSAELMAC